ncbi:MAG TPA: hypothetical protein VKW04_02525 [Planctomycetota bacterium]|nr:hypothetical protein [Planctomycetota bacterium]
MLGQSLVLFFFIAIQAPRIGFGGIASERAERTSILGFLRSALGA